MCGLTGFWDFNQSFNKEELINIANNMANQIKHRGPDDHGVWLNESQRIVMAHRRLAIMDLTEAGKQPMHSKSGRFTIVYNGEVYNAPSIQKELALLGDNFNGHSDTEVILSAFDRWGVESAIVKFIGMFAIAVWDQQLQELSLIRDRLGVKPLHYGMMENNFFFGSELKSFFKHPLFKKSINIESVARFVKLNYVPTPYSIFKDIYKLEPATILKINKHQEISKIIYWDLEKIITQREYITSERIAIDNLHELLKDSINLRMLADVPVGAFLSGGIDSSLVVSLMQSASIKPIKTFTVGFTEKNYNEAEFANQIAKYLNTSHHEIILEPHHVLEIISKVPDVYDEPFADSSQIPMLFVSQLAKQHVKVSLSGDGGDELFAGYNRYYIWQQIINKIALCPKPVRKFLSYFIKFIFLNIKNKFNLNLNFNLKINNFININNVGDKLNKLANILSFDTKEDFYKNAISFWLDENPLLINNLNSANVSNNSNDILHPELIYIRNLHLTKNISNFVEQMQITDLNNYLLDDILTKVDRATMSYSIEAREPLLDHRIVEFAWRLPMDFKIRSGQQKWILRQILSKYLPNQLIDRSKMGFGIPIGNWLRKDLREWAVDLLSPKKLDRQGLFNSKIVHNKLDKHLSGKEDCQYDLWGVLMFQAWYEKNLS